MGEEFEGGEEQPLDIESFRERLESRHDLSDLFGGLVEEKLKPFFDYESFNPELSLIVVDFGLTKAIEPTVVVFFNGFIVDIDTTRDIYLPQQPTTVKSRAAAPLRFLGKILNNEKLANSGISEVQASARLSWDTSGPDITGWLTYLTGLAMLMGIKRIGILEQPGWTFQIPQTLAESANFYLLPNSNTPEIRASAYEILKGFLTLRQVRVYEGGHLNNCLKAVQVTVEPATGKMVAGESSPVVDTAAAMCLSFQLDEKRRMKFIWE